VASWGSFGNTEGLEKPTMLSTLLPLVLCAPKGLSRMARLGVLALGVALLPLLPGLARPEKKTTDNAAEKKEEGKAAVARLVGEEEATEFANMGILLVGGAHDYFSVAVSPDGRWAAAGGGMWNRRGDVRLWDLRTRREVKAFAEAQGVASVTFSPDSRRVASAGWGPVARVRDVASGKEQFALRIDAVARLAYSPNGKLLASASEGRKVKLWDATNGAELADLEGAAVPFYGVAFSRDGKTLAAGGAPTTERPDMFCCGTFRRANCWAH
jgi:WD40 repeat protein